MDGTRRGIRRVGCARRRGWLYLAACSAATWLGGALADDSKVVAFDPAFLPDGPETNIDLSRFARGNPVLPGTYEVDIWMNDEWQGRRPVRFATRGASVDASPCIERGVLEEFGVASIPGTAPDDPCVPLGERIPHASARLDISDQRLDVEVPQAAMVRRVRGVAPREQWRDGITAARLAWRGHVHRGTSQGTTTRSLFFSDEAGLNLGRWRLRHAGALSSGIYRSRHSFLERAFDGLQARGRLGDFTFDDDLLDPLAIRGARLVSDPRMRPDAMTGYTPLVRGVARSHARVTLTQGGVTLRELSVPPGPFLIDDLGATGRGGDIDVEVAESDGRRSRFRVPFFAVPELLREGDTRYAVGVGRLRDDSLRRPFLAQASWRRGLRNGWTLHAAQRWTARGAWIVAGAALDTLGGAFATDLTRAFAHRSATGERGAAGLWRFRYGRRTADGSVLSASVAQGTARPLLAARGAQGTERHGAGRQRQRRADVFYQRTSADGLSALSLGLGYVAYAQGGGEVDQTLSWNRAWHVASLDVSLRRSRQHAMPGAAEVSDTVAQFSLTLPLGAASSRTTARLALGLDARRHHLQAGVAGAADADGTWSYAASAASDRGRGGRLDTAVSGVLGGGEVGITADRSNTATAASLSASGGVLVHAGGVTFAPSLGESVGLVRARDARGARLASSATTRIDDRGFAVVTDLAPYRWNTVDIDPTGLPLEVTFASTHARVVPTAGAVVLIPFETAARATILLTGRRADGTVLPFGAEVIDAQGRSMGFVGQGGRAFVRWDGGASTLSVRWSGEGQGQCLLRPEPSGTAAGLKHYQGVCE